MPLLPICAQNRHAPHISCPPPYAQIVAAAVTFLFAWLAAALRMQRWGLVVPLLLSVPLSSVCVWAMANRHLRGLVGSMLLDPSEV